MHRPVLALSAAALAAAIGLAGCKLNSNDRNGALSSGIAPVGTSQQGPFGTTCTIVNMGYANLTFHNTSARNHTLRRYTITMQTENRKQLKPRHIHFATPITINGHTLLRQKQVVTDRAVSCQVEKAHS